jgi:DNA-binding IscR family transcriptional regulator
MDEIKVVSRRTVLRDIGTLREDGFIIHSEPGRGGGLQLPRFCNASISASNIRMRKARSPAGSSSRRPC